MANAWLLLGEKVTFGATPNTFKTFSRKTSNLRLETQKLKQENSRGWSTCWISVEKRLDLSVLTLFQVFFTATTSFRPQKKLIGFQQGKKPTTVKLTFHAGKTVNMFCQSLLGDKLLKREEVASYLKTLAQEVTKKVIEQMFRGLPFRRSFVSQLMARWGSYCFN